MSEERENVEAKSDDQRVSIGRIPLKQVRVNKKPAAQRNPMNLLVPYLDLFSRLTDEELSRLSGVTEELVAELRQQVVTIDQALSAYADLLPRLSDREMVRLTGATPKTIRFWRLCQPRVPVPKQALEVRKKEVEDSVVARAASAKATTAPFPTANADSEVAQAEAAATAPEAAPTPVAKTESQPPPPPTAEKPPKKQSQQAASRLMSFSGDPFPGFDESAAGFEGVPAPDEVEVALADLEEEVDEEPSE